MIDFFGVNIKSFFSFLNFFSIIGRAFRKAFWGVALDLCTSEYQEKFLFFVIFLDGAFGGCIRFMYIEISRKILFL